MDTKKEVARIVRRVAEVQIPDLRLPGAKTNIQIPMHLGIAGVTQPAARAALTRARAEHAESDRRKVAPPIVRKP